VLFILDLCFEEGELKMTRQIKHKRFMSSRRYKNRGEKYSAGSLNKNTTNQQYKNSLKVLAPFADADKDGVRNIDDCYPFDKNRHYKKIVNSMMTTDSDGNTIEREPTERATKIGTSEFDKLVEERIIEHNKNTRGNISSKFIFNTSEEALLWIEEYLGQISDGKWENTSGTAWEFWSDLPIEIDRTKETHIEGSVRGRIVFNFNDLIWLFDKSHEGHLPPDFKEVDVNDVRSIFSAVPTDMIKKFNNNITNAIRNKIRKD